MVDFCNAFGSSLLRRIPVYLLSSADLFDQGSQADANRRLNLNLQRVSRWRQNLPMGNVLLSTEIGQPSSCGPNYEEARDSKQNRNR